MLNLQQDHCSSIAMHFHDISFKMDIISLIIVPDLFDLGIRLERS